MFCSKCGKKIKVSAQNVEAKTTINIKNKKMMIIMIGTIATLILIVLLAIIVPKLKTNLEEQKYQKELQTPTQQALLQICRKRVVGCVYGHSKIPQSTLQLQLLLLLPWQQCP